MWTKKGLSKQSFPEIPIGLRAHSLHGAELNQSLEQSRLTCCRYIIPQKKPQQDAEASTTTAMVSLLQCEGR